MAMNLKRTAKGVYKAIEDVTKQMVRPIPYKPPKLPSGTPGESYILSRIGLKEQGKKLINKRNEINTSMQKWGESMDKRIGQKYSDIMSSNTAYDRYMARAKKKSERWAKEGKPLIKRLITNDWD